MPSLAPIANRSDDSGSYQLPDDGWYQLAPIGAFPAMANGRRVVQVLDAAAIANLANTCIPEAGLLIDYDHDSMDMGKHTRAAGWITALENRADGLYAQIRWAGPGLADVQGGAYRYLSPVFDGTTVEDLGSGRVRPRTLLNAALTNDPNLSTLRPLTNRNQHQHQEPSTMTPAILKALGLPEDATDEQAIKKAAALLNRTVDADKLQAELDALRQQQLEAQVDADLEVYAAVIANRDQARKSLLADRESTLNVLKAIKPPAERKELPNRKSARVPDADPETGADIAANAKAAAIRNRACQIQNEQHVTFQTAWTLAQQELA